ncbi:general substrate transporter [Aureobasidium pullulans EXF-150]|uniref:General substrate transporter n=1 Tax=Aureobasidium pullulans EXF-150 TaxID=1043002 RepID=A0A074WZ47_AURPU|nr:general substrate transporter [Aureobasidium pullulans EXF-150]KEQ78478.1 general substrate transporter [Aureobasidium pullulans EXF-150]
MGFLVKKPADIEGSAVPAIFIGLFVAFGGVLFGYDTGTIGGIIAMPYWKKEFSTGYTDDNGMPDITSSQSSMIVSILSAGTFFGALTAAPTGDFFGRRLGLIISVGVFTLGVILQTAATAIPMFVAGRFFAGYGVGMVSPLIPLYQSETSPKWIRGAIVGAYQLSITIGLLLAAVADNATKDRNDTGSYRIPIAIQFAWGLILVGGVSFLPETPRFLVKVGKEAEAAKSLSRLRRLPIDNPSLVEELAEITANHEYEISLGKATYLDCFKGNLGKRLATGCLLQALQQLTGVNFIFYFGTSFFTNSGIDKPFVISMITSTVNTVSTFPGLYAVDKFGRRSTLLGGAIGMTVCQFIVAITGTVADIDNMPAQRTLIAFVCIYIFFFASTWGPNVWVVTGETFPLKVRAKALSMTTASNWLLNWALAYMTPYLVNSGPGNADLGAKVFFIWGSSCFICIFFVWALIYETKGLSLEQVDELYSKVDKAWKSTDFVPTVSFQNVAHAGVNTREKSLADIEAVVEERHQSV